MTESAAQPDAGKDRKAPLPESPTAELVGQLYAHLRVSQAVALVNAVLLVFILSAVVDRGRLAWWLTCLVLVTLARLVVAAAYARTQASRRDANRWRNYFAVGVLLAALVWGAASWLLYPSEAVVYQVFLMFTVGGLVAGSMTVLTPIYWLFAAFALVALLPIVLRFATGGDAVHYGMATLATIFLAAMLVIGKRVHATIEESLRLRFKNRDLIADLQREKALLETRINERTAELQALDRQKNTFLAMLSHELRNPLAPIRNSLFLLGRVDPRSARAREAINVIDRQTAHITRLVDDLLDVSRIEQGKIELRRAVVDLKALLSSAVADHLSVFEGRGVQLLTKLPEDPVYAHVDATRIAQVVGNLLQNAAKFTPVQGETDITLCTVDGIAEIRIRDTGSGIDPALLPMLFEPFTQGEQTLARTEGGIGLGLALVKGIVEMHGGTVEAESAGPNAGALFTVRLPVVAEAPARTVRDAPVAETASPRRVLVVDDNRDAADSLSILVQAFGHQTAVAYDGPSALAEAQTFAPDIVLCDLGLPGMSGYQVARALRAEPNAIRLIAVSGYAMPDDIAKAMEAGFDSHVTKPAQPDAVRRLLE